MERPRGLVVGQEEQEEQELLERAFFSWAEFSRFFDAWCQQRLALFFIQSSMHLTRCHWARLPPLYTLIDVLKYSYVRLVCKDVRAPSRPAMGHHEAGCPAFIIVKLSPLRDRLVVTECRLTHSHPACPIEFAYYFRPGRLLANTCLPVRTTNKISKQFLVLADVHRLLSYCKDRDHSVIDALRVLQGLFHKDPEAKPSHHRDALIITISGGQGRCRKPHSPEVRSPASQPGQQAPEALPDLPLRARGNECSVPRKGNWGKGGDGGGPWLEGERWRGAQVENERAKGRENGDWGGAPPEGSLWRGAPLEEWARELETRDRREAQSEREKERGVQVRYWRGVQLENQKVRGLEGSVWRRSQLESEHKGWRGAQLEGEQDWGLEGYVWRGPPAGDQGLRSLEGYAWRMAQWEDRRIRLLQAADGRSQLDCARARALEGGSGSRRGAQAPDAKVSGLKPRDQKGLRVEAEKGGRVEVRHWRGAHLEKPPEPVPESRDQRAPHWGQERRGPEVREDRGVRSGVKRRRDLEDVVLVQLGDTRATGLEDGEGGGTRSGGPQNRRGQGRECLDAGGRCLGLGNGVAGGTPTGTVFEGDPEWPGDRPQEGSEGEGPREPKRPRCPSGEKEVDWEPLAKFRAACGPELADLVAEELSFARQHGTRGFHVAGAGFALKDGTSDFFLDGALTRCSCSIHAARHLPCRHLFAARLLTGAALFHVDLLRDCWGRAPES
ncbi:PREDICTED: uncharacterized protein C19orf68 homolog [Myotis davidii]|uniref:uncharacterized protein C19orf68 homolog n=1 Tax=Myotis davidii TaxID=225400 RepID=UPI000767955E|nr:PREDICTED: uncharacterized protein C19orf68 homolog [Myotis davidii]